MARRRTSGPTEAELEVLQVLWEKDTATVGQVNDEIEKLRPTGYTTTLKIMQVMAVPFSAETKQLTGNHRIKHRNLNHKIERRLHHPEVISSIVQD